MAARTPARVRVLTHAHTHADRRHAAAHYWESPNMPFKALYGASSMPRWGFGCPYPLNTVRPLRTAAFAYSLARRIMLMRARVGVILRIHTHTHAHDAQTHARRVGTRTPHAGGRESDDCLTLSTVSISRLGQDYVQNGRAILTGPCKTASRVSLCTRTRTQGETGRRRRRCLTLREGAIRRFILTPDYWDSLSGD